MLVRGKSNDKRKTQPVYDIQWGRDRMVGQWVIVRHKGIAVYSDFSNEQQTLKIFVEQLFGINPKEWGHDEGASVGDSFRDAGLIDRLDSGH